jgi:hypothetical protein
VIPWQVPLGFKKKEIERHFIKWNAHKCPKNQRGEGPMLVGVPFFKMLPEGFMLSKCTSKFTKKNVGDF